MRAAFWTYLTAIAVGLGYFIVLGFPSELRTPTSQNPES